jgi:serine/threonine protein kinase
LPRAEQRIGPFRLLQELESGAGVSLWAARRDDGTQREPRLATLRITENLGDKEVMKDLRAEYDLLRLVDDPRVPKPLGFFSGQGALALAQRPGISLKVLLLELRDGLLPMSPATALDLALEIAHAVRAVHAILLEGGQRIPHGHLTPGRIWLTRDGEVQVLGLGARLETATSYLPPERGEGGVASIAGDQWQQAAMLFEMVTLEPLLLDGERAEVPVRLSKLDSAYPALARTLHRALALRPEDRYPVDREWIRALHSLLRDGGGVSGRKELVAKLLAARKARAQAPPPDPAAPVKRERMIDLQGHESVQAPPEAPGLRLSPPAAELPEPIDRAKDWETFEPPLEEELLPLIPIEVPEVEPEQLVPSGIEAEPIRRRSRTESVAMVAFVCLMVVVALMLIRLLL